MHIKNWYLPDDQKTRDALHWEIFKQIRQRSIAYFGTHQKKRFNNIGNIGVLKKDLEAKINSDDPNWDIYATVEYVKGTTQTDRETFKKQIEEGKSISELADKYGTYNELVKDRKNKLEQNRLGKNISFTANYKQHFYKHTYTPCPFDIPFDIDGDEVIVHRDNIESSEDKTAKEKVDEQYSLEEIVKAAHEEAQKITSFLNKHNTPYTVKFSGGRGFHIRILREDIEDYITSNSYADTASQFKDFIIENTEASQQTIDTSIYGDRQIYRVPYTMHTKTNLVALPLTAQQFNNFQLKYVSPDYIRNNMSLRDRGLCKRTGNANRIIKEFQDWKEETGRETDNNPAQRRREREIKQLARKIERLDDKQKEKLKQRITW